MRLEGVITNQPLFIKIMIVEILKSSNKVIKSNFNLLATDYLEKTGREVCRSCPSDIQNMLSTLRNIYNMTLFELRKPNVIYKLQKGLSQTISNDKMNDELAIAFIKIRPSRIELFSKFPENWKELIQDETSEKKISTKKTANKKKPCVGCKKKGKVTPKNENL